MTTSETQRHYATNDMITRVTCERESRVADRRRTFNKELGSLVRARSMLKVFNNLEKLGVIYTLVPPPAVEIDPTRIIGTWYPPALVKDNIIRTMATIEEIVELMKKGTEDCECYIWTTDAVLCVLKSCDELPMDDLLVISINAILARNVRFGW
jgi:hypothetical protein